MDPTMPGTVSPYSTAAPPGAGGGISPTQLQAILAALKQQQAPGGAAPASTGVQPQGQAGQAQPQSQANMTGNMIKGLISPPPTSILGKVENGIGGALGFGSGSPQPGAAAGSMTPPMPQGYQPMDAGNPMNIAPSGVMGGNSAMPAPMPGSPNAFGAGAVPTPFTQAGSPDAMSQLLMGGGLGF